MTSTIRENAAPAKTHPGLLINEYTAARLKHGTASHQLNTYFEQDRRRVTHQARRPRGLRPPALGDRSGQPEVAGPAAVAFSHGRAAVMPDGQ